MVAGTNTDIAVTNAESSLLLSADTAARVSVAVQAIPPRQIPLRLQIATNLSAWFDWKWVTNSTAQYVLAAEGITNATQCFFRVKPMGVDLTNWKLELPVDTPHAGVPDEIKQPELTGYQNPPYFHTNTAGRGIIFMAPCGGVATTNSVFPRSEMREMTNQGKDRAEWSTTSGVHTMEIVQAITHLPVVKPELAAGQVHNATTDVIMFKLAGHKLFVTQNSVPGPVLTSQYQLGDVFAVKCIARNGGVEFYYNGQYIHTYTVSDTNCYFKAGCYLQSNTNLGDASTAYGEVVIYGLTVTHEP